MVAAEEESIPPPLQLFLISQPLDPQPETTLTPWLTRLVQVPIGFPSCSLERQLTLLIIMVPNSTPLSPLQLVLL